jgi:hypothetical protein
VRDSQTPPSQQFEPSSTCPPTLSDAPINSKYFFATSLLKPDKSKNNTKTNKQEGKDVLLIN